jgi:glycosyltransferase involved in cell wall biosynthesis
LATNPRLVKEADALYDSGYGVSVVSCTYAKIKQRENECLKTRKWSFENPIEIGGGQPAIRRLSMAVRQKIAHMLVWAGSEDPFTAANALHQSARDLRNRALCIPADLYIAHYPAALPAAAAAAKKNNSIFAYDAEDFHLGDWTDNSENAKFRRMVSAIESRYLRNCKFVTASSPMIAEALTKVYGLSEVEVILNVFPKKHAPVIPRPCMSKYKRSVYWFSQTIGPNRGLECCIKAIARAKARPHLYLRGELTKGYLREIRRIAEELGVARRVHILSVAPPDQMIELAAGFQLGLAPETVETQNRSMCLTNKIFTYLLAGVPPLMSDTEAQARFAREFELQDLLFSVNSDSQLATLIDRLLLDQKLLSKFQMKAWQLGQDRFNWEVESRQLISLIEKRGLN